jgi:glutaryl-CoA dehydrogenase
VTTTIEKIFNISDLVTDEEREWQMKAREFAQTKIAPIIDDDFENRRLATELVSEVGAAGFFGMYMDGYGLAGASAVAYGLVAMEFEAVDFWLQNYAQRSRIAVDGCHLQIRFR